MNKEEELNSVNVLRTIVLWVLGREQIRSFLSLSGLKLGMEAFPIGQWGVRNVLPSTILNTVRRTGMIRSMTSLLRFDMGEIYPCFIGELS